MGDPETGRKREREREEERQTGCRAMPPLMKRELREKIDWALEINTQDAATVNREK